MQKFFRSAILSVCFLASLHAQKQETYSRVKIHLDGKTMTDLSRLGIETDHGRYEAGQWFQSDFSEKELNLVKNAGFRTETLISDLTSWYLTENAKRKPARTDAAESRGASPCEEIPGNIPTPKNYTFGSMGGYYNYEEFEAILDDMRAKFPKLISAKQPLHPTLTTFEGRPVWLVKISDNADTDEGEPEALYTAIHHAREPNSMTHLIFFMWHLLENYENDEDIKFLLDNAELYFAPCLNPDGYIYNQTTSPQGGGFWRKNRRDNGDGSFGVDLNRNYGYEWGHDDGGSSPNSFSDTYRGDAPFSEAESQMIRAFALVHNFKVVLNCHTFSNKLVHPWGYTDAVPTADLTTLGNWLNRENGYAAGSCFQTLNYFANGTSDDWWWGSQNTLAYTPETGPQFWPFIDEIDGLNKSMLTMNLSAAWYTVSGVVVREKFRGEFDNLTKEVPVEIQRYKIGSGPVQVSAEALTANVESISAAPNFTLTNFEKAEWLPTVTLKNSIQPGEPIKIVFKANLNGQIRTDTLSTTYSNGYKVLFEESGENVAGTWQTSQWAETGEFWHSPPSSMTDSPGATYEFGENALVSNLPLTIPTNATEARIRFFATWSIEPQIDFAQLFVSDQNGNFVPMQGIYSVPGLLTPSGDAPVWDGFQNGWVEECIDLQAFIGFPIQLKWLLSANFGGQDGFYFDDLILEYKTDKGVFTQNLNAPEFWVSQNQPNPANGSTAIFFEKQNVSPGKVQLEISDAVGRQVAVFSGNDFSAGKFDVKTDGWNPGVYFYRLVAADGRFSAWKKMVVH